MSHRRKRGSSAFFNFGRRRRHNRAGGFGFGEKFDFNVSAETKHGILVIFLFVLAALSILGLFDLSGGFGRGVVKILSLLFGDLKWLFPALMILFGYFLLCREKYRVKTINYVGGLLLVLGLTSLWHLLRFEPIAFVPSAADGLGGGYLALILVLPLAKLMAFWGAFVVSLAIFLVGLLLTFETSIYGLFWPARLLKFLAAKIKAAIIFLNRRSSIQPEPREAIYEEEAEATESIEAEEEPDESADVGGEPVKFQKTAIGSGAAADDEVAAIAKPKRFGKKIELPLDLLVGRSGKPTAGDIKAYQEIIRKTLANFGIEVEMGEVNIGPTFTQYTLRPADGVKLSRLVNLNSDLALALAAHPIRIEAPIPGKSLVGIEVPNQTAAKVTMFDLLAAKDFKSRPDNLFMALGKDVSGRPYFASLDRMPHLLIAGATGSGKSVCINSIIVSLLYQNSPDDLKFILVDPKRVELPVYNGIPYLLTPVITEVKKTINALKWTVVEMERRFELLSRLGKRNIVSYNQGASEKLPYIVFVIDELADLMATAAVDVEAGIVRLAQMARAVGIHLILATQRPSVEVITGLIKANVPARIAFSVASLIDSRTILDSSGAEKLVGRGDMLYLGPEVSRPKRLQGVYLSDREITNVIDYIRKQGEADYVEAVVERSAAMGSAGGAGFDDDGDSLLGEAKEIIRQSGKASASLLQRRLKIGYARAARILDLMEEQGVIGPADGAKPREVYLEKLGGVDAVSFSAREHDLEGELRPLADLAGEEEAEPSFTDFSRDLTAEAEEEPATERPSEDSEDVAAETEEDENDVEETNDVLETESIAETEAVFGGEEKSEEEEEGKPKKKSFGEDEWT